MENTINTIKITEQALSNNEEIAKKVRETARKQGITLINMMGSPNSGKTELIIHTIQSISSSLRCAVIAGSLASTKDIEMYTAQNIMAIQIQTEKCSTLDANMVIQGLNGLTTPKTQHFDVVFIENIGSFGPTPVIDTGAHINITLLSFPEGSDLPLKHPTMFYEPNAIILTKSDCKHICSFDPHEATKHIHAHNKFAKIMVVSTHNHEGISEWVSWLKNEIFEIMR